jgi:hypothetical protein
VRAIPNNVKWFERLWVGCTLAYLVAAPFRPELFEPPPATEAESVFAIVLTLTVAALTLFFVLAASRRRKDWARWLLLILYAATLILVLSQSFDYYREHLFGAVLDLVILGAEGLGLALLFRGDAKDWLRAVT